MIIKNKNFRHFCTRVAIVTILKSVTLGKKNVSKKLKNKELTKVQLDYLVLKRLKSILQGIFVPSLGPKLSPPWNLLGYAKNLKFCTKWKGHM